MEVSNIENEDFFTITHLNNDEKDINIENLKDKQNNDKLSNKIVPVNVKPLEIEQKYTPDTHNNMKYYQLKDEPTQTLSVVDDIDRTKFRIYDANSPSRAKWDILMVSLLVETAIMVPFEIAFLDVGDSKSNTNFLFYINRLIDIIFVTDMYLQFHTPFVEKETGAKIYSSRRIFQRYIKTWFFCDFISIFPFELLSILADSSDLEQLKMFRTIRLLRLFKIIRVFRASRIFDRWESNLGISYAVINLFKFIFGILMLSHWMACLWGIIPQFEVLDEGQYNWQTYYNKQVISNIENNSSYIVALYWSIMTITTIGYGDVIPQTDAERFTSILCMIIGGGSYAYIVGAVCGIISSMGASKAEFNQLLDHLNQYMIKIAAPKSLAMELRRYCYQSRDLINDKYYFKLVDQLSPGLRGKVAIHTNGEWTRKIKFFAGGPYDEDVRFVTAITGHLKPMLFPPQEDIIHVGDLTDTLYIVSRGLVARLGRVMGKGSVFGEDLILAHGTRHYSVGTLTYTDCYCLTKKSLNAVLNNGSFPSKTKAIRRAAVFLALQRKFKQIFSQLKIFRAIKEDKERDKNWLRGQLLGLDTNENDKTESILQCSLNHLIQSQSFLKEYTDNCMKSNEISSLNAISTMLSSSENLLLSLKKKL